MDESSSASNQSAVDEPRVVALKDEDIIVVSADTTSSADVRRTLQNQQNYQNN